MKNTEVKKKHFISTLGTSVYVEGNYVCKERNCRTKFVQQASLEIMLGKQVDRITICMTDLAEEKNWENRNYTEKDIEQVHWAYKEKNLAVGDKYQGLKEILENRYPGIIDTVRMVDGSSQEETDQMFQSLYDAIGENEEVYLDITHGFRFFPMLAITVLEYAKVTKNITVGGIYYGMFGRKEEGKEIIECPLLDLTYYSDILDWSNAADAFVRYGNSKQICDLMKPMMRDAKTRKEYQSLRNLVNNLNYITRCIETGRGKNGGKHDNSIQAACEKYKESYRTVQQEGEIRLKPLKVLMNKIDEKVDRLNVENNLQTGLSVVQWSIENDMIQQGYTALDETIKTYVCNLAGVDDSKKWYRETFANGLVQSIGHEKTHHRQSGYEKWQKQLKAEKEDNLDKIKNPDETIEEFKEKICLKGKKLADKLPLAIFDVVSQVGEQRNDINHFGLSEKQYDIKSFENNLVKSYKEFLKLIQENPIPEKTK